MTDNLYQIKDNCRSGLLKYLAKAVCFLPQINNPKILDIGCGTGVPAIWLAENYGGIITAIDTDKSALKWFQKKTIVKKLENRINTVNISFSDLKTELHSFDIIVAEGFLNITGFEEGFVKAIDFLKKGGYFVIHDEYRDHEVKVDFIRKNSCELIGKLFLDEGIWWNDYYRQLESEIYSLDIRQVKELFKRELREIELYKKDPMPFRSIYYIIQRL